MEEKEKAKKALAAVQRCGLCETCKNCISGKKPRAGDVFAVIGFDLCAAVMENESAINSAYVQIFKRAQPKGGAQAARPPCGGGRLAPESPNSTRQTREAERRLNKAAQPCKNV